MANDVAKGTASGLLTGGASGGIIGAALGGAAGALGGLFGGSGEQQSGYKLTAEYDLQLLNYFQEAMQNNYNMMAQNQQLSQVYQDRLNTVAGLYNNTIPSAEATSRLRDSTMQIAQYFGGDIAKAHQEGYLDNYSKGILDQMQQEQSKLASNYGQEAQNPEIAQQQASQRRQLQQDLQRQGVSPAQQNAALYQFDQQAKVSNYQNNLNESQYRLGALQQQGQFGLAAKQQGFGQAYQQFGALQGQLGFVQQGLQNQAGLAGLQYGAGQQGLQTQRQLSADVLQYYQQLGQFDLSSAAKNLTRGGVVGPGSVYQQTGVPYNQAGNLAGRIGDQEKQAYQSRTGLNGTWDAAASGYNGLSFQGQPQQRQTFDYQGLTRKGSPLALNRAFVKPTY